MKILQCKVVFLLIAFSFRLFGQIDTEFWFAAPDISSEYGQAPKNGAPIRLHFTALYSTTVTVSRPADPTFSPIVFNLTDLEHKSVELNSIIPINQIETYPRALTDPSAIQDKGFKITAYPGEICSYYELDNKQNKDIFPLKGTNGLGKEFFVSTQDTFINGDYKGTAWSGFVIVATEDNTSVTVELNDDLLHFVPHPAAVNITLNAGQTYAFRALSTLPERHINGVRVTSTNNIAVTVYDDAMQKERVVGGTSWDLFGDQLVPLDIVGTEYIVMKGFMVDAPEDGGEKLCITATQDNTMIYIDNNPVPIATINKGSVYTYEIINQTTLVTTSEPVYVNHITGFEADLGGAILPPIGNCSGSYDVAFNRSPDPSESFYLNIMVKNITTPGHPLRNQAAKNFSILSNGVSTPVPESCFMYILDSTYAVLKRDPAVIAFITGLIEPGWAAMVRNPVTMFHLGIINGHINTGCKYGYFSDYKAINSSAGIGGALSNTREVYCDLDPVRLVARGGLSYEWTCTSDPSVTALISNTTIADPYFSPITSGNYMFNVHIIQACGPEIDLPLQVIVMYRPIADFDIDVQEACSPLTVNITHKVDMSRVGRMEWYFDYPNMTPAANQDTLANPFQWSFPENNTDSVVPYKIRLFTWAPYNACPDDIGKTVLIKPGVNADFTVSDSTGCHPLNVSFNNLSTGHLDNQSYYWDFGDGLESYDSLPVHNYINFNSSTVTFDARLIVTSPLDCKDTASRKIEVFPYIKGSLLVDSATRCSPIHSTLSPVNSIGVDTFFYTIQSPQFVQSIKRVTKEEITLTYSDTTYSNGPDTIRTTLVVQNRMGCSDTVSARNIVVYPEVAAKFDVDEIEICDNSQIQISNQSFGQNVLYTWDFGDGSSSRDSTLTAFMHTFYNPGDIEKDFVITLEGLNEYLCSDTYDTIITVFPRVNAFFTIESGNNCAPLNLRIENLSHRVETYEWDYGDGSPLDNTSAPVFYHYYENPLPDRDTTYILTLRVESPEGCYDSIKRNVYLLPQVVADFDMSDSVGCSPATVTFQNNSTGMDLLYSWQFGDLVKSNNNLLFSEVFQNLSANDSTFDVVLTAINSQGCESSMTRHFTIYPFVNAVFGVDNQTRCSPFTVNTFNYSSAGSKNYSWSFGDGNKSNAFEPSHQYVNNSLTLRRDTLRLIVNNDHACYDTAMKIITVYPELHVDFQVSEASGCQPLLVSFENLTNIIPNTSFFWDFDDETYSTSAVPSPHTFTNVSPGSVIRNIQLAGISQYGCSDTFIRQVEIFPEVYAHFITDKPAVCSGDSFLIDRSTSRGAISNYYWDFNSDGITDDLRTDDSFSYSFENTSSSPVTMNLKLTVANEQGCDTSWSRTLMVYPAVNAGFVVDASSTCYPNPSVFQNISQFKGIVATKFTWNFGDGTYSTSINDQISHNYRNFTYDQDREYVVNLVAESDYHCSDSFTDTVLIHPKPKADFEFAGKSAGCPPFTPNINNTSEGTNLSYSWTLENGSLSSSTDFEPVSTFENVTNDILSNKITLVTTTEFDCRDTSEMILMVYPGVTADFTASPQWAGCDPLILDLDGLHNENAVNFMWDFDDGSTSTLEDPQHLFTNDEITDREFEVYFRALSAYGCEDDTVKIVTLYSSPSPEFSSTPMLQEYDTVNDMTSVTFTNLTEHQDIWDYEWDFGDNTTSDNNNPAFTHTYGNLFWGEPLNNHAVLVKLYAANRNNPECSNSISHDIVILPPRPQINIGEDVSGCVPLEVGFSATVKYTDDTYDWDFGYNNETSTEAEPVFEYTEPGIYMVRLIVNGPGGINVDSKEITVYANPEVDFTFAPSEVLKESQTEPSEEIKFYNNTNFAESYEWYYRYDADYERIEEPFSVEKEPFLTLNDTGYYWVTLVAETSHGCRDSFIHPTPIYVKGTKEFEMPDYFYVDPDNITSGTYKKGVPMDGLFFPRSMGVEKYKLEIYNRWGELIFSTDNINTGWNGCIDNNPEHPVSQGVYVWKVKATFTNGQTKMYAGDVTLLINPERSTPDNKLF